MSKIYSHDIFFLFRFEQDFRGTCGGVELGFLSTTLNKEVALQYSGATRKRGTIFEVLISIPSAFILFNFTL